jgi:hypothetical protein
VPYLNGGLFEKAPDDDRVASPLPDEAFAKIITELFTPFNFTVYESSALDEEVAVDPEMLGKVFEQLVTGRHESGSYYTPRPVVTYMCREALKTWLGDGHEALIEEHNADTISVPAAKQLLNRLEMVKVVDPACGSGAYLLGMLHELHAVITLLDTRAEQVTARDNYQRKLTIIENCLYGVDKEEFAVNIARLRLWLALIVEYDGATPEPLPNLDFKVEIGDSLSAPMPEARRLQIDVIGLKVEEFARAKADFADPHFQGDRQALRQEIQTRRAELADWMQASIWSGFNWRVEFAEVFYPPHGRDGGFDIVLANPPYVRQELIKDLKPNLKSLYPEVYSGAADLYCYFYARGVQLLRASGALAFISSNKWFRARYGVRLREHMATSCAIISIMDFGELPVFQTAATFPMIVVARKGGSRVETRFTQVQSLNAPWPDVRAVEKLNADLLPATAIVGAQWNFATGTLATLRTKMEASGVTLGEYVGGRIYRGVLTGFNEAFVIDGSKRAELIAKDPHSNEIIKPLAKGDDIRKWRIERKDTWLIVTEIGVNMHDYPAVFEHLMVWQSQLESRSDKGSNWWELRPCSYYDVLPGSKIIYPEIAKESRFTLDRSSTFPLKTVYSIPTNDLYLLGVLNSRSAWSYLKLVCSSLGDPESGGRLNLQTIFTSILPIPIACDVDRLAISNLVQHCLDAKGVGCGAWEQEIDQRVEALYGL